MVPGDVHKRHVCTSCGEVHYINPRIITGCLGIWKEQILLCQRAIEPAKGKWTLPAGFLELGEPLEDGAKRETYEEAEAKTLISHLHTIYSLPSAGQVHCFFLAEIKDGKHSPGVETLASEWFTKKSIPWDEVAFHSVRFALNKFIENPLEQKTHMGVYPE